MVVMSSHQKWIEDKILSKCGKIDKPKWPDFQNLSCDLYQNKISMGVNFIKNHQNLVISKVGKSQNKVGVTEEIGSGNEIVLSKIGWGDELRQSKSK